MPKGENRPVRKAVFGFGDAVAVRVAQQGDAVGAGHFGAGLALEQVHERSREC